MNPESIEIAAPTRAVKPRPLNVTAPVRFSQTLRSHALALPRFPLATLQINVGKLCNQACTHCHVEAGPKRTEIMTGAVVDRLLTLAAGCESLTTIDLTGGAPELNPHFRRLVMGMRALGLTVLDRCNLSVLFEPGQADTAEFLATQGVHVVASLPCYSKNNVDKQRGLGVWDLSVRGLRVLNALGYGKSEAGLQLDLVYNPVGAFLPPDQSKLQADYKVRLKADIDVDFNRLYTITNMPISRFLHQLKREQKIDAYMDLLLQSFNAKAAQGVMCRNLVSVGYDGALYDCDFNQMLELPHRSGKTIFSCDSLAELQAESIVFADHCYACTAGSGSSCGGALA